MRTLTAIGVAFGLLFSTAFAQEKSAEQLREESLRIFGIEGQESQSLTRVVASGAKLRVGFYVSLNPDCTSTGDIKVRVTKQPEHGTAETAVTFQYVTFPKENVRSRCNQHSVKGVLVNYKSAEKYVGDDAFDVLLMYPGGFAREVQYNISVR